MKAASVFFAIELEGRPLALDALELAPSEALMVGDRASHDGGATAVGITTLLLPPTREFEPRGLRQVLVLATEPA